MPCARRTVLALLLLAAAGAPADAAVDPASCAAAKLRASAKGLVRRVECEAEAARRGAAVRPACVMRADQKRLRAFMAADPRGACFATGDAGAVGDALDTLLDDVRTRTRPPSGRSRCARLALEATGVRGKKLLKADAAYLDAPDPAALARAHDEAQARFTRALAKALGRGDCAPGAEAAPLTAAGDTFVTALRALLVPSLQALAATTGRRIGAAVQSGYLADEPDYTATLTREFGAITAEFEALWLELHPAPGVYEFAALDALAAFAAAHGMHLRGHHLVWDMYYPEYLNTLTPEDLRAALEDHIRTVAGRYRGRMTTWVVVNEAVNYLGPGLKPSLWLDKLGPGYIADAFRLARAADPEAELIYNDVFAEGMGAKADFIYGLLRDLLAAGVPIDGVGFQTHHFGGPVPPMMRENLQRFADLGLSLQLTEMDVPTWGFPGGPAARLEAQREIYHGVVAACLAVARCQAITFWGFTDKHSWIDTFFAPGHQPLPFDAEYRPKPAYFGIRDALLGR